MFFVIASKNEAHSDTVWCTVSWLSLPQRDLNVAHLTLILYLHYLVKRSIRSLQVNDNETSWVHSSTFEVLYVH